MRAAWLLVLLAACIVPEKHYGKPCGSDVCGASEVCDLTDPKGATCIPADGDLDGDGIPNRLDFCDHMPGGDTDEDGDGIGDVCDPCPIAPPPSTPDPDGDAVDRPCDPDEHTPGDQILLFEGFQKPLDANWKATTATVWMEQGGELVVTLAGDANADYMTHPVTPKANVAVLAAYRVDRVETGSSDHFVVVAGSDPRPAGVATMSCGIDRNDTTASDKIDLETNLSSGQQVISNGFDTARLYEVGGYATGGSVACTAVDDSAAIGVVQAGITPDSLGAISLGARAVTARYEWVLVVGRD